MEKTEMMKRYETETDECATWTWHEREFLTDDYIAWLEAKAEAYDRLMSGKATPKDLANILGKPVAIDAESRLLWFPKKPESGWSTWIWYDNQFGDFGEELPDGLINFNGDWKDSLTLPDGWEE